MRGWVARIVLGVVAILLGASSPAAVFPAEPAASTSSFTYDAAAPFPPSTMSSAERGPPVDARPAIAYDAAYRGSHGVSARPNSHAARATYGYDNHASIVQVAGVATTTQGTARGPAGPLTSRAPSSIAANTGLPQHRLTLVLCGRGPCWKDVHHAPKGVDPGFSDT